MARVSVTSRPPAPWAWGALGGLLGVLLALVLFAPAQWVANAVLRATGGQVVLHDPRGTVWNGSAQLVLTGGAGSSDSAALPSRLDWRLRPTGDGLRAEVFTACCTPQPLALRWSPRWGGGQAAVSDAPSQWPVAVLAGLGTPWNTLQLDGELALSTQGLTLEWTEGRLAIAGRAEMTAQRVSSRLSTLRPMGSYQITVQGGDVPTLQLATVEGSLQLSGRGQWVGSRLRFTGEASAAPEREAALANLLNIIGRRTGARSIITIG